MRKLWPIEQAVFEAAAHDYRASANALAEQMVVAQVTDFENTGAGFFSTVSMPSDTRRLSEASPLDVAIGTVAGTDAPGMGFLIFLEDGRVSLIEGYTFGMSSTVPIDFSSVDFKLIPWSLAGVST